MVTHPEAMTYFIAVLLSRYPEQTICLNQPNNEAIDLTKFKLISDLALCPIEAIICGQLSIEEALSARI